MTSLSVPTLCIITGGNGGLGRGIAIQLSQKFGPGSTLVLVDLNSMEETAEAVKEKAGDKVEVRCVRADLADVVSFASTMRSVFGSVEANAFKRAMLIHNVASSDKSGSARACDNITDVQEYSALNLSGPIVMTAEFLKVFGTAGDSVHKVIINISSEAGWVPLPGMHLYGAFKAARDHFFRILALEEAADTDLRILTYTPGIVDTEGLKMMSSHLSHLKDLRGSWKEKGLLLTPEQSADVLIKILEEDNYKNAETIQCFTVLGIDPSGNK